MIETEDEDFIIDEELLFHKLTQKKPKSIVFTEITKTVEFLNELSSNDKLKIKDEIRRNFIRSSPKLYVTNCHFISTSALSNPRQGIFNKSLLLEVSPEPQTLKNTK